MPKKALTNKKQIVINIEIDKHQNDNNMMKFDLLNLINSEFNFLFTDFGFSIQLDERYYDPHGFYSRSILLISDKCKLIFKSENEETFEIYIKTLDFCDEILEKYGGYIVNSMDLIWFLYCLKRIFYDDPQIIKIPIDEIRGYSDWKGYKIVLSKYHSIIYKWIQQDNYLSIYQKLISINHWGDYIQLNIKFKKDNLINQRQSNNKIIIAIVVDIIILIFIILLLKK